jgi:hypothetical protein
MFTIPHNYMLALLTHLNAYTPDTTICLHSSHILMLTLPTQLYAYTPHTS